MPAGTKHLGRRGAERQDLRARAQDFFFSRISTFLIAMSLIGRLAERGALPTVGTLAIVFTVSSPSMTRANTVTLPSMSGCAVAAIMKMLPDSSAPVCELRIWATTPGRTLSPFGSGGTL